MKITLRRLSIIVLVSLLCVSLSACAEKENKVVIGCDNTTEEAILGEILKALIENHTDIEVELIGNIAGGETILHPAILKGEIDMYPEYTGTAWTDILGRTEIPEREVLLDELFTYYENEFDLKWVGLYGFNNSYGLGLYKPIADKYNIKTYSDLSKYADQLVFCATPRFFERKDGFEGMAATYNFKFKGVVEVAALALKYDAVTAREVDVINIFTTDGRLADTNLVLLEDDKGYFPEYLCGTVVHIDTLKKYPELEEVLMKADGILSDTEMAELNYRVETLNELENEVALNFLREKGLINE